MTPYSLALSAMGNPPDFTPFGQYGSVFKQQGWYPASEPDATGAIEYRSGYNSPFNKIIVDPKTGEQGYLALIGNKNQKFSVAIKDKNGNIVHTIMSDATPDKLQTYLTNSNSNVAQRVGDIAANYK